MHPSMCRWRGGDALTRSWWWFTRSRRRSIIFGSKVPFAPSPLTFVGAALVGRIPAAGEHGHDGCLQETQQAYCHTQPMVRTHTEPIVGARPPLPPAPVYYNPSSVPPLGLPCWSANAWIVLFWEASGPGLILEGAA